MMGITAREVVASALIEWLERGDLAVLGSIKQLEDEAGVWEWGKWAVRGESNGQGVKAQIQYRGSPPESTAWDAIVDISDEEGMRIEAAMLPIDGETKEILRRVYMFWESTHDIPRMMKIPRNRMLDLRRAALESMVRNLQKGA